MLERPLATEARATEARRRASLEPFASLPAPWRLADFDFKAQPSVDRALVNELGTLRFLEDATNVLFIGPPGVGTTMLATGLAGAAVEGSSRAYYTTAADLAAHWHRAAIEARAGPKGGGRPARRPNSRSQSSRVSTASGRPLGMAASSRLRAG